MDFNIKISTSNCRQQESLLQIKDPSTENLDIHSIANSIFSQTTPPTEQLGKIEDKSLSEFDEVTKYLPNKTELLNRKLPEGYDVEVLGLLKKGEWEDFAGHDMEDFACQALQLLYNKKITVAQFTTCTFYWSLRQKYPAEEIKIVPLFNENGINKAAKEMIMNTITTKDFTEELIDDLFEKIKKAPASEQFFFLIEEKSSVSEESENPFNFDSEETITQAIQRVGINVFTYCDDDYRMIASLSMMQEFLNSYAGDQAVQIIPRIKESSMGDIKNNGKNSTRDLGIPFIGAPLPETADELLAPNGWDFWMHDFYHAFLASLAPPEHRQNFIKIAERVLDLKKEFSHDEELCDLIQEFSDRLVDMEIPQYLPSGNLTEEDSFTATLNNKYNEALSRLAVRLLKKNKMGIEKITSTLELLTIKIAKIDLMVHLAKACLKEEFILSHEIQESICFFAEKQRNDIELQASMTSSQYKEIFKGKLTELQLSEELKEQFLIVKNTILKRCDREGTAWMKEKNLSLYLHKNDLLIQLDEQCIY